MRIRWNWLIGICLLLALLGTAASATQTQEYIRNGGFEQIDAEGKPADWFTTAYRTQEGFSRLVVTSEKAHSGQYSALVENASQNDARFIQTISVEPESMYRFSGYVLVESMEEGGRGANFALEDVYAFSEMLYDTQGEWQYVEWYGETGPDQTKAVIGARIGGYGAESVGKAYFDDISVVKVDTLPGDLVASLWYKMETTTASVSQSSSTPDKSTLWFAALALAFVTIAYLCKNSFVQTAEHELAPKVRRVKKWTLAFIALMLAALAVRLVLSRSVEGYQVDINCFTAWSLRMAFGGPVNFYADGYFCDYPPGYMLMLWPIGLLLNAVGLENLPNKLLILKSIPVLCDMVIALFLFLFARKRTSGKAAVCLALLFTLNPAALVNGAAWGQVDSLLALLMLLTAFYAMRHRWQIALPLYVIGALVKPQALLLAPVGLIWLIASIVRAPERSKCVLRVLWGLLIAAVLAFVVVFPFAIKQENPLVWLIDLYSDTLSSYGYATLNTANLYYLLGANWRPLETEVSLVLPLVTGLVLLAFGIWQMIRCKGFSMLAKLFSKERTGLRGYPEAEAKFNRFLLSLLSLLAGAAFFVLSILGCTYQSYGIVMMAFVFMWALAGAITDLDASRLPFYMALALIGVYVLGIKIHERYLFVALPLLLMGYVTTRDKRLLGLCVGFSATTFINTAIVLDNSILFGSQMGHLNSDTLPLNIVLCILNLLLCGYAGYVSFDGLRERMAGEDPVQSEQPEGPVTSYHRALLTPDDMRLHLGLKDWLIMGIVTVCYAGVAFTNLGSTSAPQNGWISTSPEEQIVFELESDGPYNLLYYAGVSYESFSVSTSADGTEWLEHIPCEMRQGLCYHWKYAIHLKDGSINEFLDDSPQNKVWFEGRYLRLNAEFSGLNLYEIIARDESGERIPMRVVSHTGARESVLSEAKGAENLLDEQDTLIGEPGWFNSMYFDEIYHGRTAYEHLHGESPYETTHPPLGKLMMSLGIAVFGMTPFGWRFAGAMIGVLMLPALYLLAKQLFKRRDLAAFAMLLLTFDLMHFTQTRIATIDSFPVFFIMLSYLCMARYMMTDILSVSAGEKARLLSRAFLKSLIPLALSGLFMGLSIASKWIGLYSAVGLAALFFTAIYRQFRIGNIAFAYQTDASGAEQTEKQKLRIESAQSYTLTRIVITCGCCVLFFLLVPAVIYYLSYIPYLSPTGAVTIERVIAAQENMLRYHATPGLGMDHPFQSPWWQWPFILKPMWFAKNAFTQEGFGSTIMCLGNPLIFYVGAVCMVAVMAAYVCKYLSFRSGLRLRATDGNLMLPIMVVGFLAQYLPWVLVPRSMFIYHYFASVPFIILATTWVISRLPQRRPKLRHSLMWGYVALAAVVFVLFYPYASGMETPVWWLDAMKWFSKLYY